MTRNLYLALGLVCAFTLCGCCSRQAEAPREESPVSETSPESESPGEESKPATLPATVVSVDDEDRRKLADFRRQFEERQYAYIIPPAEALLGRPTLDPVIRLELAFLLNRCYAEVGEKDKAAETIKKFEQLKKEYLEGEVGKAELATRGSVRRIAAELRKRRAESLAPDERERQSDTLKAKLDTAPAGSVLEVDAEGGGTIVCSNDAKALLDKLSAGGQEPVIHHDTEYDFYYSIAEQVPPEEGSR